MKQLQFLIFISCLARAFSLAEFYEESGKTSGLEIWEMNKVSYTS